MRYEIKTWFDCHPDIHPDDARNAIAAWYRRSYRDRRRKRPHQILEKLLISSAMNDKDGKKMLPPVWRDRQGKILVVPSDGFEIRWKRAQKDGRVPPWDEIDGFILRNWRVIRRLGDLHFDSNIPGLIEWSPRAATALIRSLPIGVNAGGEAWYVKKRNRLGLRGQRRYRVHDFWLHTDGFARIDHD
jgi:hypothetical protein